jgi:hypothetical protein
MKSRPELEQIKTLEPTAAPSAPPLSQSRFEKMACERGYAASEMEGKRIESDAAIRGRDIHRIMAAYVSHLVKTRQATDYDKLDALCENESEEVREVMLEKIRDTYKFNPEHVLGVEMHIRLNDQLGSIESSLGDTIAFEGTLDLVLLPTPADAVIHDWKSFFRVQEADTFQSRFYPLLLMSVIPTLERVEFILEFVRYGTSRSVEFTREDLPKLKEMAYDARARQLRVHAESEHQATPGKCCLYCPLVTLGCPLLQQVNPYANMEPSERVAFGVLLREAMKHNDAILKEFVNVNGPVEYRDANENRYLAEFRAQEKRSYSLKYGYPILEDHCTRHPSDQEFIEKLTISGLSSPLKAKKRGDLKEKMQQAVTVTKGTRFRVGKADEEDEEEMCS